MPKQSLSGWLQTCPVCLADSVQWLGQSSFEREDGKNWVCSNCGSAWTAIELLQCMNYQEILGEDEPEEEED